MKRKILSIALVFLAILGLMEFSACGNDESYPENVIQDQQLENEVKSSVKKLSKKSRDNLNYEELLKDIDAVNNYKSPIYALPSENEDNQYEVRFNGEGYYCKTLSGGEVVTYVFYSEIGDKRIYSIDQFYKMSTGD